MNSCQALWAKTDKNGKIGLVNYDVFLVSQDIKSLLGDCKSNLNNKIPYS